MVHLGSDYGGWVVPAGLLGPSSICYLAGCGEDIPFDLELESSGWLLPGTFARKV